MLRLTLRIVGRKGYNQCQDWKLRSSYQYPQGPHTFSHFRLTLFSNDSNLKSLLNRLFLPG